MSGPVFKILAISVTKHGTDKLKAVLEFDGHKSFNRDFTKPEEEDNVERNFPKHSDKHGLDKLRFWRCCIEHTTVKNHLELMTIFPELLFEAVEVFHHTLHLNSYMPSIAYLFKDMGWDKLDWIGEINKRIRSLPSVNDSYLLSSLALKSKPLLTLNCFSLLVVMVLKIECEKL